MTCLPCILAELLQSYGIDIHHDRVLQDFSNFVRPLGDDTISAVWQKSFAKEIAKQMDPPPLTHQELVMVLHYLVNIFAKTRCDETNFRLKEREVTEDFTSTCSNSFLNWYVVAFACSYRTIAYETFRESFSRFLSSYRENVTPVVLHLKENHFSISLHELSLFIDKLPLETFHAVWERVDKNRDGVVGDTRSLLLLIHVFFCLKIKQIKHGARYPDPNAEWYLEFMQRIVDCLSINFASREVRERESATDFVLKGSHSRSPIVVGFEDLVESMPHWLQAVSNMLSQQTMAR